MRKLLLILLVGILAVTAGMIVVKGIETDNFSIDSYMTIAEANNELDDLINQASSLKETSYKNKKNQLDSAYKQLVSERESYEELLNLGVDRNGIPLSKIQEYEIEKIWITLGTYAEEQGIDLKLDISVNNSVSKTYDLNFTINGTYTEIEDFIRKVQEDNTLVFKIENFKLVSSGVTDTRSTIMDGIATQSEEKQTEETPVDTTPVEESLTATFVCKDIKLNIVENTTTSDSDDNSSTDSTEETTSTSTKKTSTTSTSTKTTSTTTSSN